MSETLGIVSYLNARPLTDRLDRQRYRVIADHPAAIARGLRDGAIDLALSPAAAVLSDGDFRIVGGWCIGAEGPVDSVLLVAEVPPERWSRVVLDGVSRTSAVLARLLLAGPLRERVPADLVIEDGPPGCALAAARGTAAALVIGDAARGVPPRLGVRLDLAGIWTDWTGLPFVFAVWAGRPDLPAAVRAHVREAGAAGVAAIADDWSGDERRYLMECLRYPLDDRALMGLRRFAALAASAGLIPPREPSLYGPAAHRGRPEVGDLLLRAARGEVLSGEALARIAEAPVAELALAADLRRRALHAGDEVGYWLAEDAPECVASADADTGTAPVVVQVDRSTDWVALRWRVARSSVFAVQWAHGGSDALAGSALARLALPDVARVIAPPDPRLAQPALRMGCDHWGVVQVGDGDLDGAVAEVERQIRAAGFGARRDRPVRPARPTAAEAQPAPSGR